MLPATLLQHELFLGTRIYSAHVRAVAKRKVELLCKERGAV